MDLGINFRTTSGFVTDSAGQTYCIDDAYPTTRGGFTFGIVSGGGNTRDRNSGSDVRLAGIQFTGNASGGTPAVFRLDLPSSGSYDIYAAFGDFNNGQHIDAEIGDNGSYTTIASNVNTVGGQEFVDATGTLRTSVSDWVSNNAKLTKAFSSTVLQIRLGGLSANTDSSCIAHLRVVSVGGSSPTYPQLERGIRGYCRGLAGMN